MAIDVRTVRLGNKVLDTNLKEYVLIDPNLLRSSRLSGIKITPENLRTLRFIQDHASTCWVRIEGDTHVKILYNPEGYYHLENFPKGKLQYTHQLQNLIFDLTGEETPEFDQAQYTPLLKKR